MIDLAQPPAFAAQIVDRSRQTIVIRRDRQTGDDEKSTDRRDNPYKFQHIGTTPLDNGGKPLFESERDRFIANLRALWTPNLKNGPCAAKEQHELHKLAP